MNMFSERTSRQEQKEATAQAVLDAARAEFEAHGFEGANLRAIAARAGVSAGTVLHHHGDKRELLHAALFHDLESTLAAALDDLGPGPLENQLDRLGRAVFGYYERRPALSRALVRESLFAEGPWAERFRAQVTSVHAAIATRVEEARDRGELRADVDGAVFAVAWFSFFYFALIAWVQGGLTAPVALVGRLVGQHLAGLCPVEPRMEPKKAKRRKP